MTKTNNRAVQVNTQRITILQGAFLPVPPLMGGAVEKIWFEMGKQFASKGHQVTHVSRAHPNLPEHEVIEGVLHKRVRGHATTRNLPLLKLFDLLYTLRALSALPEADVVVTNTFWAPLLLRRKHGRIYASVERFPKGQMRLYRKAARLRVPSTAVREAVLFEIGDENSERVSLIPNALPFTPRSDNVRQLEQKQNIILYVGRVHPEKGLELLIKALRSPALSANFGNWSVNIVGPWATEAGGGGDNYYSRIQREAAGLPVYFAGPVNDEDKLREFYQEASIFVYPSIAAKAESFGLAPLEAMAHGCVPIVSNLDCFKDFMRDGKNGMTFDHQASDAPDQLAMLLAGLITNTNARNRLATEAAKVGQTHDPRRIADLFMEDFSILLAGQTVFRSRSSC